MLNPSRKKIQGTYRSTVVVERAEKSLIYRIRVTTRGKLDKKSEGNKLDGQQNLMLYADRSSGTRCKGPDDHLS